MSSFFSMLERMAESMGIKSSSLLLIVAILLIAIVFIGVRLVSRKKTTLGVQKAPSLPPKKEHIKARIVETPPKPVISTKKVEPTSQELPPVPLKIPSEVNKAPAKAPESQPAVKGIKEPEARPLAQELKEPESKAATKEGPKTALPLPKPAMPAPLTKRDLSPLATREQEKPVPVDLVSKEESRTKGLGSALQNTRGGFMAKLSRLFSRSTEINDEDFEEMEAILFTADIGAKTAQKLLDGLKTRVREQKISGRSAMEAALKEEMRSIFKRAVPKSVAPSESLSVYMFIGVNGAGKTTSIGKLGAQMAKSGKKVFFGAGDTFRAAAVKQLAIWGERAGIPVITGKENADSASVLFDAITEAKKAKADVVLCDTAGRLHTKMGLMDELKKVHRVMSKAENGAPHEVFLVIDATMGQNAIAQAREFAEAAPLTGVVLSKLDGTAKGGVALGIVDELEVPIRFVGIGEQAFDLKPFDADEFIEALFNEN